MTCNHSHATLCAAFIAAVKGLAGRLRSAVQKLYRGYRRVLLTWRLRQLDRYDNAIYESVKQERLYLKSTETSAKDMLIANNRRRYSLQRRLMDLDAAAL